MSNRKIEEVVGEYLSNARGCVAHKEFGYIARSGFYVNGDELHVWVSVYRARAEDGVFEYPNAPGDITLSRHISGDVGCDLIRKIIDAFGVANLNDLRGRRILIHGEGVGRKFKPLGISKPKKEGVDEIIWLVEKEAEGERS